jgi:hypothetical protein
MWFRKKKPVSPQTYRPGWRELDSCIYRVAVAKPGDLVPIPNWDSVSMVWLAEGVQEVKYRIMADGVY